VSMLRKTLLALTASLLAAGTAQAEWHEATSKHFTVYADDSPERIKAFTERMERFNIAVRVLRNAKEVDRGSASRVTIFQVGSIDEIEKLSRPGVGGFYIPRASGSTAFVPRSSGGRNGSYDVSSQRVLMHEYSHHVMFNDWPEAAFPKWYIEGLAEFNSTAMFRDDGSVIFGAPPLDRDYGTTMVSAMPASRLLKVDPGKLTGAESYALYSRGWLLAHYLTFDAERRKQLAKYIVDINAGVPAAEAGRVFGDPESLDAKMNSYLKRPKFASIQLPADQLPIGDVSVRKLTPAEAAIMPVRIRSTAGVNEKAAAQVVLLARTAAAPYPNDAAVQNALAEAEYDVKNYAAAEAAAGRALSADPKSVHAALYRGMALEAIAVDAKSKDSAQWAAVRRAYLDANKIDPENAEALIRYYGSYAAQGIAPTKNAADGMLYAYLLAPFSYEARMNAGRIYLERGNAEKAKQALLPVTVGENAGESADELRAVLATLDKDGPAAAVAQMDKDRAEAKAKAEKEKTDKAKKA
jgi:hypothetical protein